MQTASLEESITKVDTPHATLAQNQTENRSEIKLPTPPTNNDVALTETSESLLEQLPSQQMTVEEPVEQICNIDKASLVDRLEPKKDEQTLDSQQTETTSMQQSNVHIDISESTTYYDSVSAGDSNTDAKSANIITDNGIFDFMIPEKAIELYKRIHASGMPDLEWKFYGRRKPGEQVNDDSKDTKGIENESQDNDAQPNITTNTEFDFDEDFSELNTDTSSFVNDSLCLKKRPEPGTDRKTNLSDIMSDIMKESHQADTE